MRNTQNTLSIQVRESRDFHFTADPTVFEKPIGGDRWLFIESVGWLRVLSSNIPLPEKLVSNNDIEIFAGEALHVSIDFNIDETVVLYFEQRDGLWYWESFSKALVDLDRSKLQKRERIEDRGAYQRVLDAAHSEQAFLLATRILASTCSPLAFEVLVKHPWFPMKREDEWSERVYEIIFAHYSESFLFNWACQTLRQGKLIAKPEETALAIIKSLIDKAVPHWLDELIHVWKEADPTCSGRIVKIFFDMANRLVSGESTNHRLPVVCDSVRAMISLLTQADTRISNLGEFMLTQRKLFARLGEYDTVLFANFAKALEQLDPNADAVGEFLKSPLRIVLERQPNWWIIFAEKSPRVEVIEVILDLPQAKAIIGEALANDDTESLGLQLLARWIESTELSWRCTEIAEIVNQ